MLDAEAVPDPIATSMTTLVGLDWNRRPTAHRVGALRTVHGIHAYRSAEKNGEWGQVLTLGASHHRLIRWPRDRRVSSTAGE